MCYCFLHVVPHENIPHNFTQHYGNRSPRTMASMNTVCTGVNPLYASPPLRPQPKGDGRTCFSMTSLLICGSSLLEFLAPSTDHSKTPTAAAPRTAAYSEPIPLPASLPQSALQRQDTGNCSCCHTVRLTCSSLELKDFCATPHFTDYTLLNRLRQLKIVRKALLRRRGGKRRKTAQPGGPEGTSSLCVPDNLPSL